MFALGAAVAFFLALLKVQVGSGLDLVVLGFLLLAVHFAFPLTPWRRP